MAWLAKVLGKGESPQIEEIVEPPKPVTPSKPPLLLLVSDASGMAALRLVPFSEAQEACDYIEFWYPNRSAGTLYAIWALPQEPDPSWAADPDRRGDAVILVRDERKQDVVYSFSFADLKAAWAFLRTEMEKDLDLTRVMIYWAVPIDIEVDDLGKVRVSPDAPPKTATLATEPTLVVADDDREPVVEVAAVEYQLPEIVIEELQTESTEEIAEPLIEEEPAHEMPVAEQPQTTFVYHDEPAIDDEDLRAAAESLFEDDADDLPADVGSDEADAIDAMEALEVPEAVEEVEPIEALPELVVEKADSSFHETEFIETPPQDEEPLRVDRRKSGNGRHKDVAPEPVVDSEEIEVEELVVEPDASVVQTADAESDASTFKEEDSSDETIKASANGHKPSQNGHHQTNGHRPSSGESLEDKVTKVLKERKLPQRDEPFQGFNSPRGRF